MMRRVALFVVAMVVLGAVAGTATAMLVGAAIDRVATAPEGWAVLVVLLLLLLALISSGMRGMRRYARSYDRMRSRLGEADERRRSVLADVAHELRTPLAVIRGQAEGIADGVYPGGPEDMAPILEAIDTVESLVADLQTMVLAEAGALRLRREPIDLAVLANETVATVTGANPGGARVSVNAPRDLPQIEADPARLRSVLSNLLNNALRHTPADGSVNVVITSRPSGLRLVVIDTGEGIPPELLPRVFERFTRGEGSPGSGLGLAIAADIVKAHGGAIAARSEPGEGTEIQVNLPLTPPDDED